MVAKALMFQATGTDAGKTLIVAGVVRALTNRGLRVRPFKSQNLGSQIMVTPDGGEISKAQALQAIAARVPLSVHMNPVLLKPFSETDADIVVQGQPVGKVSAANFQSLKAHYMPQILESFNILKTQADIVIIEGAGSPAEVNLRAQDIANMGFAEAADVPVMLIGDIDRGGVIASIVGTKEVLEDKDANRIKGFLINKFRGDPELFADGMQYIEHRTGWKSYGLIPFFWDAMRLKEPDDGRAAWAIDAAADPKKLHERAEIDTILDAFANHLETHLDMDRMLEIALS